MAHHACTRQYLSVNNGQESFFIPTLYRNKEAGLGFEAKAIKNPLPFDFETTVILHLAKPRLVNLNSCSRSSYWRRMMIHDSVGTNLTAIVIPIYHRFCWLCFVVQWGFVHRLILFQWIACDQKTMTSGAFMLPDCNLSWSMATRTRLAIKLV